MRWGYTIAMLFACAVTLAFRFGASDARTRHLEDRIRAMEARLAHQEEEIQLQRHRRTLEDRLDVRIVGAASDFGHALSSISGKAAQRETFLKVLPVVMAELKRYPEAVVRRAGLRRVVICETLATFSKEQGGVMDTSAGTLYVSMHGTDPETLRHFRRTVHHEFFHLIDYASGYHGWDDPAWAALNESGFEYSEHIPAISSAAMDAEFSTAVREDLPGFLSGYARTNAQEDKAELFSYLVEDPALVRRVAARDPIVAKKAAHLKERVATFFAPTDVSALWGDEPAQNGPP